MPGLEARAACELLRLSGPELAVDIDELREGLRVSSDALRRVLSVLEEAGLIGIKGDTILIRDRVMLAVFAISRGADPERVAEHLDWRDFERLTAECLERHGYEVVQHLRFRANGRRYEVDVVGLLRPRILCIDCKHWGARRGKAPGLRDAARKQRMRAEALAAKISRGELLDLRGWEEAVIVPLMVTLHEERVLFYDGVPLVPIFKLGSFLLEFDSWLDLMFHVRVKICGRAIG